MSFVRGHLPSPSLRLTYLIGVILFKTKNDVDLYSVNLSGGHWIQQMSSTLANQGQHGVRENPQGLVKKMPNN